MSKAYVMVCQGVCFTYLFFQNTGLKQIIFIYYHLLILFFFSLAQTTSSLQWCVWLRHKDVSSLHFSAGVCVGGWAG